MATNRFLSIMTGIGEQLVAAISSSVGVADAAKIICTNASGVIDTTLLPPGLEIDTEAIITSEAISAGNFVNIYNNAGTRTCRRADCSNGRAAHGFVLSASASGATATVYKKGGNTGLTGLTPGTAYFLGTSGAATTTFLEYPSATIHQPLGFAASTTKLQFEFDEPKKLAV